MIQTMESLQIPTVDEQLFATLKLSRRDPLDDSELTRLSSISPVITVPVKPGTVGDTTRYFVTPDDVDSSFLYSFALGETASGLGGIVKLGIIYTLHEIDNSDDRYPCFSPTAHQVYRMIPQHLHRKLLGFETLVPEDEDLDRQTAATNAGFHVTTTILYV